MAYDERDAHVLMHTIQYCEQIQETLREYQDDHDKYLSSNTCRNALSMCILQIGELVGVLSDGFKQEHPMVPWKDIRQMRNIVAHRYGTVDSYLLWNTVHEDIPFLESFCTEALSNIGKEDEPQ